MYQHFTQKNLFYGEKLTEKLYSFYTDTKSVIIQGRIFKVKNQKQRKYLLKFFLLLFATE